MLALGILVRILVPLSSPALGVLGLFTSTPDMATIPLGLYQYQGQYATAWNYMMAGAAISMLPGVVLVILLQRYLVEGISISGLGGRKIAGLSRIEGRIVTVFDVTGASPKSATLRFRQVHQDFHTSPLIPGVDGHAMVVLERGQ